MVLMVVDCTEKLVCAKLFSLQQIRATCNYVTNFNYCKYSVYDNGKNTRSDKPCQYHGLYFTQLHGSACTYPQLQKILSIYTCLLSFYHLVDLTDRNEFSSTAGTPRTTFVPPDFRL